MYSHLEKILLTASEKFGTPIYFYDSHTIATQYQKLKSFLPKYTNIFYSMKANPTLAICEYFRSQGAHCEVSSRYELAVALKAGFQVNQIIFVGPGKTEDDIEACLSNNIKFIVCESISEIQLVNSLSKKFNVKQNILIRINPDFQVKNALLKMSGIPSQFGIDLNTFSIYQHEFKKLNYIYIQGIQIYNASRVLEVEAILENIYRILQLSEKISQEFGMHFKCVDIGGGFGIPYFENEIPLNITQLSKELPVLFEAFHQRHLETEIILELGRYLVAESGYLITQVMHIKKNHHRDYLIVDAGMHCHMAATGSGSFVHRNFPMMLISKNKTSNQKKNYHIAGPLCTPGDILFKDVTLPEVNIGDLIVIKNAGAYGLTASMTRFLSHGSPAEIFYDHGQFQLIRRRETAQDILSTQYHLGDRSFALRANSCRREI